MSVLKLHLTTIHYMLVDYICNYCKIKFSTHSSLKIHDKTQHLRCTEYGWTFSDKNEMKQHTRAIVKQFSWHVTLTIKDTPKNTEYMTIDLIPSYMWSTRCIEKLPNNPGYRKKIAMDIFGWNHQQYCTNENFHVPYLHKNHDMVSFRNQHKLCRIGYR